MTADLVKSPEKQIIHKINNKVDFFHNGSWSPKTKSMILHQKIKIFFKSITLSGVIVNTDADIRRMDYSGQFEFLHRATSIYRSVIEESTAPIVLGCIITAQYRTATQLTVPQSIRETDMYCI